MKKIYLKQGEFALVDDQDYESLCNYKWYLSKGYAVRNSNRKTICMHRDILGLTSRTDLVDHINHNGLDNRRENIRICNRQENGANRKKKKSFSSSKYKGVSLKRLLSGKIKWKVAISVNGKDIHLGYYEKEEEAALVYNQAAQRYYGEYAYLNSFRHI